jgi:hypothetical protein
MNMSGQRAVDAARKAKVGNAGLLRGSFRRFDTDELTHPAAVTENYNSRHARKQGVVLAPADVLARFDTGTALANDNRATGHIFPTEALYAQPLGI